MNAYKIIKRGRVHNLDATNRIALLVPVDIGVDSNRDGTIVLPSEQGQPQNLDSSGNPLPVDTTSKSKPFQFWINNDQDDQNLGETVPVTDPDYTNHEIAYKRNLEDFTRLWLKIGGLQDAIANGSIQIGLKWTNVSGSPAINVYKAYESDGGNKYLTDDSTAGSQITGDYDVAITDANGKQTVDTNGTFIFPQDFWSGLSQSSPKKYLLFEGAGKGQGELALVFLDKNGNDIGEGPGVWVDLRDIKEMYQRAIANPQPQKPYTYLSRQPVENVSYSMDTSGGSFVPNPNEDTSSKTCVVFVHGFNQRQEQSFNYAETMFKRFWQRGYRGRFAAFRWPTYGNGTVPWGAIGTYNDSEYVAWCSGAALEQFASMLSQGGYTVDVAAHSMGNVVTGKALHDGMTVAHYALLHAASSASCYSNSSSSYPVTSSNTVVPDNDSDSATKALGYTGYLGSISGGVVNFYDEKDSVIGKIWNANSDLFKPQGNVGTFPGSEEVLNYYYDSGTSQPSGQKLYIGYITGVDTSAPIRIIYSPEEAKAYVDHSLTGSVGSNATAAGAIADHVSEDSFGDSHSYEWDNRLQDTATLNFYNAVMDKMQLQRITP